ncbi:M48 family metallopeptidase [Ferrovibrio xuzhouensis]|uniref:M48 family metallopeptidase n=1 Tax=Ferrovibrio xuzhouensis TaxID=1576914 RepID=A0ABV7VH12_9PROT
MSELPASPARFMDGQSGTVHHGRAVFAADAIAFTADGVDIRWAYGDVRLLDGTANSDWLALGRDDDSLARLRLPGGTFATLQRHCPALRRATSADRRGRRQMIIWSLAAVAGLVATYLMLPWASRVIAENLSPATEQALGRTAFEGFGQVAGHGKTQSAVCTDPAGQAALAQLVSRLSQPAPRLPLQVRVVRLPMINAFALPGGYVVLSDRLIGFVANESELAGVLAHEMGHVDARHAMAGVVRSGAASFLVGLLFGDVIGGVGSVSVASYLLDAAYTRDMESEADGLALQRLQDAGIDPAAAAGFFRRLPAALPGGELPAILSTHPGHAERAARFAAAAAARPVAPVLTPAEWQALKTICAPKKTAPVTKPEP